MSQSKQPPAPKPRRLPRPWRMIRGRPRLFASLAVGIAIAVGLSPLTGWRPVACRVIGWDIGVGLYLLLAAEMMARAHARDIRGHAASQDEGRIAILVMTVGAALMSLLAIVKLLGNGAAAGTNRAPEQLVLALLTIGLSWGLIHVMFALHYAHEFYDETDGQGMAFPGGETEPDYWDFVYFSVVIGMTSQVSDVGIISKSIRRTATAHGVVSFFFNAALLALTVNIAAGAL